MFAKYLTKWGHKVIVIRSGEIDHKVDDTYCEDEETFQIYSFLGAESDVERIKRGESIQKAEIRYKYANLPAKVREILSKTKRTVLNPIDTIRELRTAKKNYHLQKKYIDKLVDDKIDVVFSTYGDLENIFAGEYAAKVLHAKWVMDFRDPIVWYAEPYKWVWNWYAAKLQKKSLKKADLYTCVSDGLRETLIKDKPTAKVVTLYNGYEVDECDAFEPHKNDGVLSFCYTGQFYDLRVDALELFIAALSDLVSNSRLDVQKIKFVYAGNGSQIVQRVLAKYHLEQILDDHGFVSRTEAKNLQYNSDVFLVLSWNTLKSQGVLTGKFYEGIRAKKMILAVVAGDLPGSELSILNDTFHYGYCYEGCQSDLQYNSFLDYIESIYKEKNKSGDIEYKPMESLAQAFQYDSIVRKFEQLCVELINEK